MTLRPMFTSIALAALLMSLASSVRAERSTTVGEFTVHYNAIPTTALNADVARHYGITRSGGRALLNISVLRLRAGETEPRAVPARVRAFTHALTGQRSEILLREVRDQDAVYYIGDFRIRGEEHLRFELEATPDGAERAIPARFEQTFIGD